MPQPFLNIVFKASLFLGHSSESGYEVLLWWAIYTDWGNLGRFQHHLRRL